MAIHPRWLSVWRYFSAVLFLFCGTLVYPLYYIFPMESYIGSFQIFTLATMSSLACALILLSFARLTRVAVSRVTLFVPIGLFLAMSGVQFFCFRYCDFDDYFMTMFYVMAPLFAYLTARELKTIFPAFALVLWVWNLAHSFSQGELVGIAGNRNWHASFLVLLTAFSIYFYVYQIGLKGLARRWADSERPLPVGLGALVFTLWALALFFLAFYFYRFAEERFNQGGVIVAAIGTAVVVGGIFLALARSSWAEPLKVFFRRARERFFEIGTLFDALTAACIVLFLAVHVFATFFLIHCCDSRAAWLGLFGAAGVTVFAQLATFPFFRKKAMRRVMVYGAVAALLVVTVALARYSDKLINVIADDVRIPLWEGNIQMIVDHPALGSGVPGFESVYAPYRPLSYYMRKVSAVRSNHSHNAILYVMGCYGVFGGLIWVYLWAFPLLRLGFRFDRLSLFSKVAFFVYFALFIHGQLDLIFYEWPTCLYSAILLGILWADVWRYRDPTPAMKKRVASRRGFVSVKRPLAIAAAAVAVLTAGIVLAETCRSMHDEFFGSSYYREGRYYEDTNQAEIAMYKFDKALAYKQYARFIYKAALTAIVKLDNPLLALRYFALFDRTPTPHFAHKPGFIAMCLRKLGRNKEAVPYLKQEKDHYPLLAGAWFNLGGALEMTGDTVGARDAFANMRRTMVMKGFDPENDYILRLLMKNPKYDMHPHEIPPEAIREAEELYRKSLEMKRGAKKPAPAPSVQASPAAPLRK